MATKRQSIVLCVIRCGETTWARDKRIVGSADLPLSNVGRAFVTEQSRMMPADRISTIYHPPDEAATETAQIFAEPLRAKTRRIAELSDPDLGLLEGLTEGEFEDRYARRSRQLQEDPLSLSPPEGEDVADAVARVFRAVAKLLRRSRGDEIGVVLHPLAMGLLQCWFADRPAPDLWNMLDNRPAIERYALGLPMIDWLENAQMAEYSGA